MAGTDSRFNATQFREAIRFAMRMGLPQSTSERVTFRWKTEKTYSRHDAGGSPFDWTDTPTATSTQPDVQVAAAVEFSARPAGSRDTPIGQFDTARAVITVLDEEYAQVSSANQVVLNDSVYDIQMWGPPIGLFEVTVYQCFCEALDEA